MALWLSKSCINGELKNMLTVAYSCNSRVQEFCVKKTYRVNVGHDKKTLAIDKLFVGKA